MFFVCDFSRDRQGNDNKSSGYGGFTNQGGYGEYRSMKSESAPTRGYEAPSGAIDWNALNKAAVSIGTDPILI